MNVECRSQGMDPRDAGCEATAPIPRGRMEGLQAEQRDGRSKMTIQESGNGYLAVFIDDRQKGDDGRHHLRITWRRGYDWNGNDTGWGGGSGWGGSGGSGGGWGGSGGSGGGWGGSGGSGGGWGWGSGSSGWGGWNDPGGWEDLGWGGWNGGNWNDWESGNQQVPGWAVGNFYARGGARMMEEIRIGRGGRAGVRYSNGRFQPAYVRDGWMRLQNGETFQIRRWQNGIQLRDRGGREMSFSR
jgi:hypothetical protein